MHWITDSWRLLLPPVWAEIAIALAAVLCGGIVGAERERREKPAGLRTLILVSLGSSIFTTASLSFHGDPGRVAAQIVAGVGFLGAGVILHGRGTVSGTTTAATIWVIAAVGMIAGSGLAIPALGLSLLVRLVLGLASYIERWVIAENQMMTVEIDFIPNRGRTRVRLKKILAEYNVRERAITWQMTSDELATVTIHLRMPHLHLRVLLGNIVEIPEVQAVREYPSGRPNQQPGT